MSGVPRRGDKDWLIDGVLNGGDHGARATLLRSALAPLAGLHRIGLEVYLAPFHIGLRKRFRLPVPVISIGNLSSGGTGKTPAAALVAQYLREMGKRAVILSRGHGGQAERDQEPVIVSEGNGNPHLPAATAGDEPALLASLLPDVPVVVCRDRRKSGQLAAQRFAPDVIVLDDGLQYWQLHRDLDIVLLDARSPFGNGHVLPRGLLREPPSHLTRAGVVILTRSDRVGAESLRETIMRVGAFARPGVPILTATHSPVGWVPAGAPDELLPADAFAGRDAIVVSGIADGNAFAEAVSALGVRVQSVHIFGDHHHYTTENLAAVRDATRSDSLVITTEKDAVKIAAFGADALPNLYALRIALQVNDEAALRAQLRRLF